MDASVENERLGQSENSPALPVKRTCRHYRAHRFFVSPIPTLLITGEASPTLSLTSPNQRDLSQLPYPYPLPPSLPPPAGRSVSGVSYIASDTGGACVCVTTDIPFPTPAGNLT